MKNLITALVIFLALQVQTTANAQIVFQETFPGNVLPAGWYLDSAGQTPVIDWWNFSGSFGNLTGAGFDSSYAQININLQIGSKPQFCSLISPSFNASTLSTVYLSFGEVVGGAGYGNTCKIEVSNDVGTSWHRILNYKGTHGTVSNPYRNIVNITSYAAGQSSVILRFTVEVTVNGAGWLIDSLVVNDYVPCNSPPDTMGKAANIRSYACTGSPAELRIDNLSRGAGQTYQWQYNNASTGNTWANIPGAVYDTATFTQNGTTIYQCQVTCGGSTVLTDTAHVIDTPNQTSGILTTNDAGICAAKNDTIYIVSEKNIPGLGYKWQQASGPLGIYTDIAGATDTLYVVTAAHHPTDTWFKCKEVCLSNGNSRLSPYRDVHVNPNPYCYCIETNDNPCPPSPSFAGTITNVNILGTTLNNTSGNCNNVVLPWNSYMYYPPVGNATAMLSRGSTYTISVSNDTIVGMLCMMWLDYNGNSTFDSSEYTFITQMLLPGASATANFTVPLNAQSGLTGLRVRLFGTGPYYYNGNSACWDFWGGETEDYMVTIDTTTNIIDLGMENGELELVPNPAKDKLTITSHNIIKTAKLLSVTGSVVMEQANVNGIKAVFDVSTLPAGIYFAEVVTDKGRVMRKWVKE